MSRTATLTPEERKQRRKETVRRYNAKAAIEQKKKLLACYPPHCHECGATPTRILYIGQDGLGRDGKGPRRISRPGVLRQIFVNERVKSFYAPFCPVHAPASFWKGRSKPFGMNSYIAFHEGPENEGLNA